jgi:DNA-binding NtrC family response regulator
VTVTSEHAAVPTLRLQGDDGAQSLRVTRCRLRVVAGPDSGQELVLDGEPVSVGSHPSCDLVLGDAAVSARHFAIEPREQRYLLRDLGSTNGTAVGGMRVESVYLAAAAEIEIGESRLEFSASDDEVEIPLSKRTSFGELLGHSPAMRRAFAILERVAPSDGTVLIEGESGTGKELAAAALHEHSPRRQGPFVTVDCGAIPPGLIESELFGHAKGAFTGAAAARPSPFEDAQGGTVFLDEVGELPLELQPKLLRLLESRSVRRLGESQSRPVDARIVAATNRNLAQETREHRFREDLYFRLSVFRVRMPALRERREEVPRLVAHFLGLLGVDPPPEIPPTLMNALACYGWPGNVRELRNVVERIALLPGLSPAFYLRGGVEAAASDGARPSVPLHLPFHQGKRIWIEHFEREYLSRMLAASGGRVTELARMCGLSRQSCYRLIERYGLAAAE